MVTQRVTNDTMACDLATQAHVANNPWRRFVGLLDRTALAPGSGLILHDCSGIHMFGMRFAIDALYVDGHNTVIHAISRLAPWHIGPLDPTAAYIVELPAGIIAATGTSVGDHLTLT